MRSIWKGAISFGLVNIPVKLYSATQQSALSLDMVDKRDHARIRYLRVNENTGREVEWENIGKAYKLDDNYIVLDDEDFDKAAPEKSKIIDVNNFVDEKDIDTIYFENSYYVEPEKSGVKAYALLREALKESGKVGIAQFVMRTAETLTVLKPKDNLLVLSKIRFAEEVRSSEELVLPPKSEVKAAELKIALTIIDQYSHEFDITQFKNEYSAALKKLIEAKASGKAPKVKKFKISPQKSQDLMEQLKASLNKKKAI
ncbi:MAG: Ku protein [Omnitrophica WOR_2 bacterium]|jgi:DNA end-binding protein Ku